MYIYYVASGALSDVRCPMCKCSFLRGDSSHGIAHNNRVTDGLMTAILCDVVVCDGAGGVGAEPDVCWRGHPPRQDQPTG